MNAYANPSDFGASAGVSDGEFQSKLKQVRDGDAARAWLVAQVGPLVGGVAEEFAESLGPEESRSDCRQFMSLAIYEGISRCKSSTWGQFIKFAETLAKNAGRDHLRKLSAQKRGGVAAREGAPPRLPLEPEDTPGTAASRKEQRERISELIARLSDPADRQLVLAYGCYGLPFDVVADILEMTPHDVRKRWKQLRKQIKHHLDGLNHFGEKADDSA